MSTPTLLRSAQETARLCAAAMWATDLASQGLGIEILAVGPGTATLAMTLTERMTNGHGSAHGGFIFALADSAFAFACNTYDERTVAAHCSITFLRPGTCGGRLVAVAREVARLGRSGIYDVAVTQDDVVIAQFRGHSRTIGGAVIAPPAGAPEE
ncbi:hydroxyphenylacetyl-CoA thioesterase PaaI [Methylobacterium nodulans]|uniref:Phenylacetic acid degradation protein PaaD n=1 Tax=Methylobacterium nodulans (strain LMG 21967 / CNCM I-2342 / ORS 2060) TaxID=460265 RepID=B8IMA2_METNO|nr:hydroxyphenylacetyl-CoA thioesterase PaaI [Methylobacterium nodulans]ACL58288.1 phenylacetic acid degradation protein PaaD [Methylobacterium nodulans ORS 2060]